MASKNLNPKDVNDLTKALNKAVSAMSSLSDFAKEFNLNISGAISHLQKITDEGKKQSNNSKTKAKQAADAKKAAEEELKLLTKTRELEKKQQEWHEKKKKLMKEFKDGLLGAAKAMGDIAGDAGFGGLLNGVADIIGAFAMGGPILGPIAILMSFVTFIFQRFVEIDKQVAAISQGLGRGGGFAQGLAANSFRISRNFASYGISIEEASEAAVQLGKEFVNLDYVTGKNQQTIALMSKQLGMSATESTKTLNTFMSMSGGSFQTAKNMTSVAMQMARSANLPLGAIMEDLSQNSEAAAKFGGKFAQSTMIASAMAKKMGMSFGDIAKMADGLLDIENSVSKQFEAQVLLGRRVNLEGARYYALIGDTNKLQREVLKQVGSQAEFEKMMPMQREALAGAIGVSVEQLGKMVSRGKEAESVEQKMYNLQKQSLDNQLKSSEKMIGVIDQIKGAITELGYAIFEAIFGKDIGGMYMDVSGKGKDLVKVINAATQAVKEGKGPLMAFITPIKQFVEWIQIPENQQSLQTWAWRGVAAIGVLLGLKLLAWIGATAKGIKSLIGLGVEAGKGIGKLFGLGSGTPKTPTPTPTTPKAPAGRPQFTGINKFLKDVNPAKILAAGAAMIMIAAALYIAAKAFQEFSGGKVDWKGVGVGIAVLGGLVVATIALGKVKKHVIEGAFALVILSGAMYIASKAFQEFKGVDWKDVMIGVGVILVFAGIATLLGYAGPFIKIGAAGILILSAALWVSAKAFEVFGRALTDITPSLEKLGKVNLWEIAKGITALAGAMALFGVGSAVSGFFGFIGKLFTGGKGPFDEILEFIDKLKPEKLEGFIGLGKALESIVSIMNNDKIIQSGSGKLVNIFDSLQTSMNKMYKDQAFVGVSEILKNIGDAFYNISKYGSANINIKTQAEESKELKKYHTESLKYLKVIALATTMMAENQTKKNIKLSNLDNDISNLIMV